MPSPGPLELIIILAIIAIFVVPIVLIVAFAARRPSVVVAPARDPALDALRIRLASGEIDEAEYQRLRATLQAS